MKTSAVMIATGGEKGFYRSVTDVPEDLRQTLLRVTAGENSGTIVIADRAGREQMTRIVARREGAAGRSAGVRAGRKPGHVIAGSFSRKNWAQLANSWVFWAGLFLLFGSAGVVAAVFTLHW
jgi:hypothetical protein